VAELTSLAPGSIPPFGSLFGLPTFCDSGLSKNEQINFNAGDHCVSICMRYSDYLAVERPEIGDFAE
jgi:Ala-tRNA(Pro) deacylase